MDDATKQALFTKLGEIDAKLDGLKEDNKNQWEHQRGLDARLRKQETHSAGISATVAAFVAVSIDAIKKGISG